MAERYSTEAMGETAENVAERYGVPRADQDAFALRSHQRAVAAPEAGRFAEQIIPVEAPRPKRGETGRRRPPTRARAPTRRSSKLGGPAARLPRRAAPVTAGNASTLNDGAACLVMARERKAAELGAEPLARIVATGVAGVDPAYMGIGPMPAITQGARRAPGSSSTRST